MEFKTGKGFGKLVDKVQELTAGDVGLQRVLRGCQIDVGFAHDPQFGIPAHAASSAIFMGDSAHITGKEISPAAEAMLRTKPENIQIHPVYDPQAQSFIQKFLMPGDEGFDPIAGQLFSPWNITYLSKVWKEPMAYSRAKEIIRTEHGGSNPFAEIFTFFMEMYAGWGAIGQTGDYQNQLQNDVNVKDGIASFPIINMMGSYSATLEEKIRNGKSWGPSRQNPISRKQLYLNYVFDMMDAILIYFGNEETNTIGLLDINPMKTWATGKSLKDIFYGSSTTRGSDAYYQLAGVLNDFLTRSDNKFGHIKIAVSPEAYNYLTSMTYSDQFDATTAMKTFAEAYLAGKGPNGSTPMIEFIAEPLLKAKSILNPNDFDLMVINAPEVGGGPENESQPTNFYCTVLDKFMFPVIPGMYNDQYKTLRRTAGVIAPMPGAVEVYMGFGTQG